MKSSSPNLDKRHGWGVVAEAKTTSNVSSTVSNN